MGHTHIHTQSDKESVSLGAVSTKLNPKPEIPTPIRRTLSEPSTLNAEQAAFIGAASTGAKAVKLKYDKKGGKAGRKKTQVTHT